MRALNHLESQSDRSAYRVAVPGKPQWTSLPVGEGQMQRISLAWFSQLGAALHPLTIFSSVSGQPDFSMVDLYRVQTFLKSLSDEKVWPLDLRASRPIIREILSYIAVIIASQDAKEQQKLLDSYKYSIWASVNKLDTLLTGELSIQPVYHVWPKRAYNVEALVGSGESIFSHAVQSELTHQEKYDVQQAGKCLAFEIPTAACFHILRCADSVLRRYYESMVGQSPKPKMRNWGTYISVLRKKGADEKIVSILLQVKDLHRNPVIHPETRMDIDEALSLIGIIESVVSAMASAIVSKRMADNTLPLPFEEIIDRSPSFSSVPS